VKAYIVENRRQSTFFSSPIGEQLRNRSRTFLEKQEALDAEGLSKNPRVGSSTSITETALLVNEKELSAQLIQEGWKPISARYSATQLLNMYLALSKAKLAALVVLTTMAGYAICPVDTSSACTAMQAFVLSLPGGLSLQDLALGDASAVANSLANSSSLPILLSTAFGTFMCIASANTFNQIAEVPYDAQMLRTRNRVLVRRLLSPLHAFSFAAISGMVGVGTLWTFVNPLTASLGLANIVLYSFIYTPLKRIHIVNTWVGSIVGAIPPMMGWAACTGSIDFITQPGAWALFALLFAWQFPHFNPLAHTLRREYARAGYQMMSVTNPLLNARVALRYALVFFPICAAFPALGLTNQWFVLFSTIPNAALAWTSYRFWRSTYEVVHRRGTAEEQERHQTNRNKEARWAFFASVIHLPCVLVMLMAFKTGVWTRLKVRVEEMYRS